MEAEAMTVSLYTAYGLSIASDQPLPFLRSESKGEPDVRFAWEGRSHAVTMNKLTKREFSRGSEGWELTYENRHGGWLSFNYSDVLARVTVSGNVGWEDAVRALVGVVCAIILAERGRTLLHGASVVAGDQALAILGASGAGKSTLAAAIARENGQLLSEDLLVLEEHGNSFIAHPGAAIVSLLSDADAQFGASLGRGRRNVYDDKRERRCPAPRSSAPVSLRAIYILEDRDPNRSDISARRLRPSDAAFALMSNLYGDGWIRPRQQLDLTFCSSVAQSVPVYQLLRPASLKSVEGLARDLVQGRVLCAE